MTISKPPLQADIAKALGIAPSRVTALKLLGMPVDSVAAALAWRQQNINPARIKSTAAESPTNERGESTAKHRVAWVAATTPDEAVRFFFELPAKEFETGPLLN